MAKFKKGDRVKVVNGGGGTIGATYFIGDILTVIKDDSTMPFCITETGEKVIAYEGELELYNENEKQMKKSDLKTGMLVETREGELGLVMLNTEEGDSIVSDGSSGYWSPLDCYLENLTHFGSPEALRKYDIVNVYGYSFSWTAANVSVGNRPLLWERQEVVEMTHEEICKALGKEIKIIKNK